MGLQGEQFGPEFFTIIAGMVFAFCGVIIRFAYRSKCRRAKCCCIEIERDVDDEMVEDVVSMEQGVPLPGESQRGSIDGGRRHIKTSVD
jgi:hypothetical protein